MEMKSRFISILLVLCMLTAVLAGCASDTTQTADTSPAQESSSQTAETEPAQPAQKSESPVPDEPTGDVQQENSTNGNYVYTLPLTTEAITYSIYINFQPYLSGYISTYADQSCYKEWQARTGINLDFYESTSRDAMVTQIALMAASGDLYDILTNVGIYYNGGFVKAISDEIILDLTELCVEYAPCYMAVVTADDIHRKAVFDDEGKMGAIYTFNDLYAAENGAIIRQDWLDNLGLQTPVTISDWHNVLTAFKDSYEISDPLFLTATGQNGTNLAGCFGTAGLSNLYQVDGQVKSGLTDDSFKEYLMMIQDWYNEGLINNDFYSRSTELRDSGVEQAVLNGECGIYYSPANTIADYVASNVDSNARLTGLAEPTADDGTINEFGSIPSYTGMNSVSISTTCPKPELAVMMLDYLFSDEGRLLCNYGIEDEAFVYDNNGEPQWTELITNNQEVPMEPFCRALYTLLDMPSVYIQERTWASYTDDQIDSMVNKWQYGYAKSLPTLSLTGEESEQYTALIADIETYVDEQVVKFIIGDISFDKWDEYVSTLDQMHLKECIDIYQAALDRYNSR